MTVETNRVACWRFQARQSFGLVERVRIVTGGAGEVPGWAAEQKISGFP
jgi:hypothetical protein